MIDMDKDQVKSALTHKQIEEMESNFDYLAHMIVVYHRSLCNQGATREVATQATLQFHQNMLQRFFPPANPLADIFGNLGKAKEQDG